MSTTAKPSQTPSSQQPAKSSARSGPAGRSDLPALPALPLLENGDRMNRFEFERRYHAMPKTKKAELIEGVVHMASPVSHERHSRQHFDMIAWLGAYRFTTPGVEGGDNGSLRLDIDNEPQPDAFLLIRPELSGQSQVSVDGYVVGAPELVCEISNTSVSIDLNSKKNAYRRNGVREYLVWRVQDEAIDWFVLREGNFEVLESSDGILRSDVFPGLWLDAAAMLRGDLQAVAAAALQGIADAGHPAFIAELQKKADALKPREETPS